jgi:hypothetical protein
VRPFIVRRAGVIGLGGRGVAAASALMRAGAWVVGFDWAVAAEGAALRAGSVNCIGWDGSDLSICDLVVVCVPEPDLGAASVRAIGLCKPQAPVLTIGFARHDVDAEIGPTLDIDREPMIVTILFGGAGRWIVSPGPCTNPSAVAAGCALVRMHGVVPTVRHHLAAVTEAPPTPSPTQGDHLMQEAS